MWLDVVRNDNNLRKNMAIMKIDELRKDAGMLKELRMNKG